MELLSILPPPSQVAVFMFSVCLALPTKLSTAVTSLWFWRSLFVVPASAWAQGPQQTNPCELKMEPQDCMVAPLFLCSLNQDSWERERTCSCAAPPGPQENVPHQEPQRAKFNMRCREAGPCGTEGEAPKKDPS